MFMPYKGSTSLRVKAYRNIFPFYSIPFRLRVFCQLQAV